MKKYPLQDAAKAVEAQGRYGDSVLVHLNPVEVQGLASLSPTGKLTRNPQTGQPEAFLPMLLPLLASYGGSTLAASGVLGAAAATGLGTAVAGGLASGVATGAMTGDWERGLVSGVMGAGLGAATGAAAINAGDAIKVGEAATIGPNMPLTDMSSEIIGAAGTATPPAGTFTNLAGQTVDAAGNVVGAGSGVSVYPLAQSPAGPGGIMGQVPEVPENAFENLMAQNDIGITGTDIGVAGSAGAVPPPPVDMTYGEALKAPFQKGSGYFGELMKPSRLLPMAVGAGQLAQMDQQDARDKDAGERAKESEAKRHRAYENLQRAYRMAQPDAMTGLSPARRYMSKNTPLPYAGGGYTGRDLDELLANTNRATAGYGGIDPVTVQKNLRGRHSVAPPKGFMPGFSPEFMYFQDDPNNIQSPPTTGPIDWTQIFAGGPSSRVLPGYIQDQPTGGITDLPPGYVPEGTPPVVTPKVSTSDDPNTETPMTEREHYERMLRYINSNSGARGSGTDKGRVRFAEGGITALGQPQPQDVQMLAMALTGQAGPQADQIVEMFVQKYGPEVFQQVRQMILQSISPNAQTEGMVKGPGGGMDDQVMGTIGGQQDVAVSPGEYIVPADVVSGLGDGNSESGAAELDKMNQKVRMARGGTVEQPPPVNAQQLMPR